MATTTFDINNFVIDHVLRGTMLSTADNSVLWSLTQIKSPSLSMTAETVDATDALGTKIMTFERAKEATFTGENALFDLGLLAAQSGSTKEYSSDADKITVTMFDSLEISTANKTSGSIDLSKVPVSVTVESVATNSITQIFKLKGDSTLGVSYTPVTSGTAATATQFYIAADSKTLKFPTDLVAGDKIFIVYDYLADGVAANGAVQVQSSADNFPTAGKFVMEVLGADICDPTTKVYAYLIFPNCKLSSETDLAFETEMSMGFTLTASQDYCSGDNLLFKIVIPE